MIYPKLQIQRERKQNRHYQETEGQVSGEKLPPSKIRKWLAPTSRYPGWLARGGTWVYKKVDLGGWHQCRSGLNLDILPLHPLKCKMPTRTVLSAKRRNRECR